MILSSYSLLLSPRLPLVSTTRIFSAYRNMLSAYSRTSVKTSSYGCLRLILSSLICNHPHCGIIGYCDNSERYCLFYFFLLDSIDAITKTKLLYYAKQSLKMMRTNYDCRIDHYESLSNPFYRSSAWV